MLRNNETFASLPDIEISRSRFDRDSNLHTTLSAGKLYPIYLDEVLPGDTFDMACASTVRMSTPIVPVMDNCYIDTYFFFVPARLCWNRWREFCGEIPRTNWTEIDDGLRLPKIAFNKNCQWYWNSTTGIYENPSKLGVDHEGYNVNFKNLQGTLVDYFGLPYLNMRDNRNGGTNPAYTDCFNMLPFEAYNMIWNEFFRDQNSMNMCPLKLQQTSSTDGKSTSGIYYETNETLDDSSNDDGYWFGNNRLNDIITDYLTVKPVSKFHDYFTSCLPQPQKHAPVSIPGFDNPIPVVPGANEHDPTFMNDYSSDSLTLFDRSSLDYARDGKLISVSGDLSLVDDGSTITGTPKQVVPSNLYALGNVNPPTINDLRYAFALQNLFERDARGGTRYIELLHTHFGVTSPDARLQRPEYLGGDRIPVNMEQVVQTSESTNLSPQGNVSGLSLTNNIGTSFTKSFTEHGYIIGLVCVRPQHSYQNGIARLWSRSERFDFYYPSLANIGEQPVFVRELLAGQENGSEIPTVFGYQEPWAEYRYKPNVVTGKMRSLLPDSLDIWHYADVFNNVNNQDQDLFTIPTLTAQFISENPYNIDRSLAISANEQPQFFGDFYFKCTCTRPMPLYSIPGLVDHH